MKPDFALSRSSVAQLLLIAYLSCFSLSTNPAYSQTSKPSEMTHEQLVAQAKKDAIYRAPILNKAGKPVDEKEAEMIAASDRHMAEAEAARLRGDFETAARLADQALQARLKILDGKNHRIVTANGLKATAESRTALSKEKREAVHQADVKMADAKRFYDYGQYEESRVAATAALEIYEQNLKEGDIDIAAALFGIGTADVDLGLFDEADLNLTRSLSIYQTAYGNAHPILGKVEDRLGWMCVLQAVGENFQGDKARNALQHFNNAIRVIARSSGENQELAESLDNRGTIQYYLGNTDEALRDKIRALVIRETLLGPDARDTGVSYSNLGWLYSQIGRRELVIPFRTKALDILKKNLDADHPFCLMETSNLARDHARQGKLDEAIKLYEEMRAIDLKKDNASDLAATDRCVELGTFKLQAGRIDEGRRLFAETSERAKQIREAGKKQDALNIMNRMLRSCSNYRLYEDGLKYYDQVVSWDDADRGRKDAMEYIVRAAGRAALLIQNDKAEEAARSLTAVLSRLRKLVDKNSLELAPPMLNLARAYSMIGRLDEAEKICEQVVSLSEEQTGSQSLGTGYAMMWLGRTNALQGKYTNAEFNFSESLRIMTQYEEKDPLGMIRLLQEQAACHSKQGDKAKAIEVLRDALTRCRAWAKNESGPFVKSSILEILKALIENADAGDATLKADREAWVSEANLLYDQLAKDNALNAEEENWKEMLK